MCGDGTSVTVVVCSMNQTGSHSSLAMRRRFPLAIWCWESGDDQQTLRFPLLICCWESGDDQQIFEVDSSGASGRWSSVESAGAA
jgi:hypothetical protein